MSPRTVRLLVLASALGVFLAGLLVGYVGHAYLERDAPRSADPRTPPSASPARTPRPPRPLGGPDVDLGRRLDRLSDRLELSAAQRATIWQLLLDGDRAARATMARFRPELEAKRRELEAAIEAVLTEPQRARYRDLIEHRPRPRPPRGPRGPGGPP